MPPLRINALIASTGAKARVLLSAVCLAQVLGGLPTALATIAALGMSLDASLSRGEDGGSSGYCAGLEQERPVDTNFMVVKTGGNYSTREHSLANFQATGGFNSRGHHGSGIV
ncbi:hypothetical protein K431DRAFT_293938 [Polychaeton citri CBS 116435]|uniref:Uncharacterized protein n=1 Tax=Polychaeton citri CBS 116435 TaxID=1314669 RepID=A0A9P4Q9Q7_9PEZI|nr:hypothetical protein K431DRAFT_293938 [Polychaeton citri CBS 116435]